MKGRGTRTLGYDDLKKVTPSVISNKTHFVIVDAVGVTKSVKTDSRPLERKKAVPLKDLMLSVMMGGGDEDTFLSLASRLGRLEKQITPAERQQFTTLAQGQTINQVVHALLDAYTPDAIEARARQQFRTDDPTADQFRAAQDALIGDARTIFSTGAFVDFVDNVRRAHEQIIDVVNLDRLEFAGWGSTGAE